MLRQIDILSLGRRAHILTRHAFVSSVGSSQLRSCAWSPTYVGVDLADVRRSYCDISELLLPVGTAEHA
jgi:hypothetical protein